MKNLFVSIIMVIAFLFQSCTVEQGLDVGLGLAIGDEGIDVDYGQDELGALVQNWSNDQCNYFEVPMQFGNDIVFLGNGLRSVNKNTGVENWNLDVGYISNAIHPLIVDDVIYFIDDDEIYVVELSTGVLLINQQWRSSEYLSRSFNIQDGIMYVNFREKDLAYSGFASCSLEDLAGGNWININGHGTVSDIYTKIKGVNVGVNLEGEHIIFYTSESGDHTVQNSTKTHKVRAYNVAKNRIEWMYERVTVSFVHDEILLTDTDQLIVKGLNFILSLSTQTGQKIWGAPTSEHVYDLSAAKKMIKHNDFLIIINGQEIATAYNIDTGQKLWGLNNPSVEYVDIETGLSKKSANINGNTLYYISSWGFLMEIDLTAGTYIKHHDTLEFSGGLIVDEDENFIAFPKYEPRSLLSFTL